MGRGQHGSTGRAENDSAYSQQKLKNKDTQANVKEGRQNIKPQSHQVRDRDRAPWQGWDMKAEAQQRRPGYTDQARGCGLVRGDKCAYLTVLKSAYTSRLFPALVHSRNTSSGRQKTTANVPCSLALSPPIPAPGLPLAMPLPSWSKWVSAPPGPGTEQTSLALRKVLHLFTSTRWPPASFCRVGGQSQPWAPEDRPLLLLLQPHPLWERHGHWFHALTTFSLLLRVGTGWGRGDVART